ncbi:MAG: hypothetical protein R3330_00710, partial [Saprospiraceae bacterium]|nr:hypothetical protein [Saprospiraceae bacterium]
MMKISTHHILMICVTLCLAVACTSDTGESASEETTTYHSGLLLQHMNTSIKPGDDFHMYVNGTWIENTEIPADKSSYGIGM